MTSDNRYNSIEDVPKRVRDNLGEILFVASVWFLMTAIATWYVHRFGSNVPFVDDWSIVNRLAGGSVDVEWLWAQQNEHRIPIAKLVLAASWTYSGGRLEPVMYMSVLSASLASLVLLGIARHIRGRTSYSDAFFPLLLLHLGHGENFIWFIQLYCFWASGVACVLLASFFLPSLYSRLPAVIFLGVCLLFLSVQGAVGIAYVPSISGSFLLMSCFGREHWSLKRRHSMLLTAFAVISIAIVVLYFLGLTTGTSRGSEQRTPYGIGTTALQFLSMGVSPVGGRLWPLSGIVLLGAGAMTIWAIMRRWNGNSMFGQIVVCAALSAPIALALGIGWGRASAGGLASRYVILAAPLYCAIYLTWSAVAQGQLARFMQFGLFAVTLAFSTYHISLGIEHGKFHQERIRSLQADIENRVPINALVGTNAGYWCWDRAPMDKGVRLLREHGIRPFEAVNLRSAQPVGAIVLSPMYGLNCEKRDGKWQSNGGRAAVYYRWNSRKRLKAVRATFHLETSEARPFIRLYWHCECPRALGCRVREYFVRPRTGPTTKDVLFWIDSDVSGIFIEFAGVGSRLAIVKVEGIPSNARSKVKEDAF